jgi:predicted  nucleic acid-binding Zn-ribbon protein
MSELEDIWCDQEQFTPRGVVNLKMENERKKEYIDTLAEDIKKLKSRLAEAEKLLHESVDNYPVEPDRHGLLWTTRVRKWLANE